MRIDRRKSGIERFKLALTSLNTWKIANFTLCRVGVLATLTYIFKHNIVPRGPLLQGCSLAALVGTASRIQLHVTEKIVTTKAKFKPIVQKPSQRKSQFELKRLDKILIKSCRVSCKSVFFFSSLLLGSSAFKIIRANSELGASPNSTRGLIISSGLRMPSPLSSQEINKSLANSTFFLCFFSLSSTWPFTLRF